VRGQEVTTAGKRPWELHAIVCVFLIAVGASVALGHFHPSRSKVEHLVGLAGMTFSLIGLFRGSRIAWWASTAAFAFLTVVTTFESAELVRRYGFIAHHKLVAGYVAVAFSSATFGLLLCLMLRGALPPRAAPLVEDLPAFHALLKFLAPIVFVVAAIFSLATPILFESRRHSTERTTSTGVKVLASAEADFRANDRDGNGVNDFWTADVAGLYGIVPSAENGATPIKLIELSTALADGNPVPDLYPPMDRYGLPAPQAGAWFATLRADRSVTPAETYGVRNTSKFGFVAYAEDYISTMRYAFILNENNTIFRQPVVRDLRPTTKWPPGPPVDAAFRDWPSDDDLKARWTKLD
jgi:hypothetical protein